MALIPKSKVRLAAKRTSPTIQAHSLVMRNSVGDFDRKKGLRHVAEGRLASFGWACEGCGVSSPGRERPLIWVTKGRAFGGDSRFAHGRWTCALRAKE